MTFNKAAALINKLSRTVFGWIFSRQKKSCVFAADQHYQENPAGGMYGQLVSRDRIYS